MFRVSIKKPCVESGDDEMGSEDASVHSAHSREQQKEDKQEKQEEEEDSPDNPNYLEELWDQQEEPAPKRVKVITAETNSEMQKRLEIATTMLSYERCATHLETMTTTSALLGASGIGAHMIYDGQGYVTPWSITFLIKCSSVAMIIASLTAGATIALAEISKRKIQAKYDEKKQPSAEHKD